MLMSAFNTRLRLIGLLSLAVGFAAPASAQTPVTGKLLVTVVDQSGGVLPAAQVTVVGQEAATQEVALAPVVTSDVGVATIEALSLGRYTLQVAFPGFETQTVRDVRVRAGDNRRCSAPGRRTGADYLCPRCAHRATVPSVRSFGSCAETKPCLTQAPTP